MEYLLHSLLSNWTWHSDCRYFLNGVAAAGLCDLHRWFEAAPKRHERKVVHGDVLLTGEHAHDPRLLPLLVYQISKTVCLLDRCDLDDGVLDHVHFAALPIGLLPVVHELVRKLVLVKHETVRLLRPGHDSVPHRTRVELKDACKFKLGFELGCEVIQSIHVVAVV